MNNVKIVVILEVLVVSIYVIKLYLKELEFSDINSSDIALTQCKIPKITISEFYAAKNKKILCLGSKSGEQYVRCIKIDDVVAYPSYFEPIEWEISPDYKFILLLKVNKKNSD